MTDRPLHSHIKNPVILTISDGKTEFHSGCRVIDINFPNISNPESSNPISVSICERVGEIHFKNSYTAFITVRAKFKAQAENGEVGGDAKWKTCVRRFRLMPNPHMEEGSQDYFCLGKKHFMNELSNITQLRVILQQPSPVWKDFRIEELKLYRSAEMNKTPALPSWLIEDSGKSKKSDNDLDNDSFCDKLRSERSPCLASVPNLEAISSSLQHLWALAEEVGAKQTERALGRYEVDGCYEINLLSYT
ncbi:nicolin-1-like isoform X1 [Mytilus californianus]|uniref:NICN1 n=1 Tax=Mytilus coruscus TaxID=42192 RepID=A0A6J8E5Y4_MYTCO|nr:nicolin-1-like isoform X1 [Mytilus californianus]CAC5415807.1 NICN1 [Mytilus coruscus]